MAGPHRPGPYPQNRPLQDRPASGPHRPGPFPQNRPPQDRPATGPHQPGPFPQNRPPQDRPASGPNRPGAYPQNRPSAARPAGHLPTGNKHSGGKPAAKATDWNGVATWYDELVGDGGSEFHREVILPGTLRLLGAVRGEGPVLDVACGQGVLCRAVSAAGIPATGIDAAADLIRIARDRQAAAPAECGAVDYVVGDARALEGVAGIPADHYAAAACVLAVQNIHPLGGLMAGVARALRPGGRFVIVMMHPAFRVPKASGWEWDAKAASQFRRVDKYLLPRKVPITTHPGSAPDAYTWTFHKPIGAYVRALRGAGLLVDAMEEWPSHKTSDSGPRAAAENVAREEVPMFLAVRAVKVPGLAAD